MTFEEDLTKRRIDVAAFAAGDPNRFAEWQHMYSQMHPNSFYVSVKMVINDVRRRFWLAEAVKPVPAPATEGAAKPVTRRATIPAATPVPAAATTAETIEAKLNPTPPTAPAKARPVIRRPVIANTEPPIVIPETPVPAATPIPTEEPAEGATPPRARPVFRKPIAAAENPVPEQAAEQQVEKDGTNSEIPIHTNPDPEAAAPKAPRPRPVIKRPLVRDTPENPEDITPTSASAIPDPVPHFVPDANPDEAPVNKPARPRPVFKRPALTAAPAEAAPASEEVTHIVTPPAPEPPLDNPVVEAANPEPAAPAKLTRPRPIMRKPTAAATEPAPTNEINITPPGPLAIGSSSNNYLETDLPSPTTAAVPPITAPSEETRKAPRPRPVFKRPPPPEPPNDSV